MGFLDGFRCEIYLNLFENFIRISIVLGKVCICKQVFVILVDSLNLEDVRG